MLHPLVDNTGVVKPAAVQLKKQVVHADEAPRTQPFRLGLDQKKQWLSPAAIFGDCSFAADPWLQGDLQHN